MQDIAETIYIIMKVKLNYPRTCTTYFQPVNKNTILTTTELFWGYQKASVFNSKQQDGYLGLKKPYFFLNEKINSHYLWLH